MSAGRGLRVLVLTPPTTQANNVVRDNLYGCWCKGKRVGRTHFPPLSLLYVATCLKGEAAAVEFLDAPAEGVDLDDLGAHSQDYDLVVASTSTMTFEEDARALERLKGTSNRPLTALFGSQATFLPESVLRHACVDFAIRNEPEPVIVELVRALADGEEAIADVKGISRMVDGSVVHHPDQPFLDDLDSLPFPDRRMLPKNVDYFNPLVKRLPYTTILTSRGCPGLCVFCTAPAFHGRKVRRRSAENVIEELGIIANQGYREVFFRDETFNYFPERNRVICEEIIRRNLDLTWSCNARAERFTSEDLELMNRAGCHLIKFGIESGSQRVLDELQKGTTIEEVRRTIGMVHRAGIDTHFHLMIGNPGEEREDLEQTLRLAHELEPLTLTVTISTPYPGSELFHRVQEKNPEIADGAGMGLAHLHTRAYCTDEYAGVPADELPRWQRRIYRRFYMRPSYLLRWLRRLSSVQELRRVVRAGTAILDFAVRGD